VQDRGTTVSWYPERSDSMNEGDQVKDVDVLVALGVFSHVWGSVGLLIGFVGLCWGFTPTWENKQV
jgi:hypothetical protein